VQNTRIIGKAGMAVPRVQVGVRTVRAGLQELRGDSRRGETAQGGPAEGTQRDGVGRAWSSLRKHVLWGAIDDVTRAGLNGALHDWVGEIELESERDSAFDLRAVLNDPQYAAHEYLELNRRKDLGMAVKLKSRADKDGGAEGGGERSEPALRTLPRERSSPVTNPWNYAYLITGEKKIGKTAWSIEGCEELVLQFDKPQLAYEIRETLVKSWKQFKGHLVELEGMVLSGESFPYQRIIVDGAGEWYQMCQQNTCRKFGVDHPSEEGYARAWHHLRDEFTDAVNRLLRLQRDAECGLVFISHAEWKEKNTRAGGKIERLVPNLPPRAEEILNGKCDAWFAWDYSGEDRIMVVQGDEITGAGHRIDGRFMTPDGRRVREIYMGESPKEAMRNFLAAFNNEQEYENFKEYKESRGGAESKGGSDSRKRVKIRKK